MEEPSNILFFTPNFLGYIFKEGMEISFSDFVIQRRMERAKKMLMDPGIKIYEVSKQVGYKNPHYFSKLFRKYTGVNPSEYRG